MRTLAQTQRIDKTEEIREKIRLKVAELVPCLRNLPEEEIERAEHLLGEALADAKRKAGQLRASRNGAVKKHKQA